MVFIKSYSYKCLSNGYSHRLPGIIRLNCSFCASLCDIFNNSINMKKHHLKRLYSNINKIEEELKSYIIKELTKTEQKGPTLYTSEDALAKKERVRQKHILKKQTKKRLLPRLSE